MTSRMLTAHELSNWDAWLAANPHGPKVRVEGAFDGKRSDGHPRARGGIDLRHFGPRGAFDAAGEEPSTAKGGITGVLRRFAAACTPEEWENWRNLLIGEGGEAEDDTEEHDRYLGEAQMRQARKRAAELAATPAMDSAQRLAFDAMYPRAGRMKRVDFAPQPERGAKPMTQETARSFAAMFPNARPVKRV